MPRPHDLGRARLATGGRTRARRARPRSGRSGSARRDCPRRAPTTGRAGPADRDGRTNAAPPSAGAMVTSQSIASRTRCSSHASAGSMIRSAISTAAGWLAAARQVRLEGVAEAAVVVPVGRDRVPDRLGGAAVEQPLEHPPVEHPRAGGHELGGRVEVRSLLHGAISAPAARRRIERNGQRHDILVSWPHANRTGCRVTRGSLRGTRSGRRPPPCAARWRACGPAWCLTAPTARPWCCPTRAVISSGSRASAATWRARTPGRSAP